MLDSLTVETHGRGSQQVRCPIHGPDRNPSARVYAEDNRLHCFTCGRSWGPVALYAAAHGLAAETALGILVDEYGIEEAEVTPAFLRSLTGKPRRPDLASAFQVTEQLLRSRRTQLALDKYAKLCMALDLVEDAYGRGVYTPEQVQATLATIGRKAQHGG